MKREAWSVKTCSASLGTCSFSHSCYYQSAMSNAGDPNAAMTDTRTIPAAASKQPNGKENPVPARKEQNSKYKYKPRSCFLSPLLPTNKKARKKKVSETGCRYCHSTPCHRIQFHDDLQHWWRIEGMEENTFDQKYNKRCRLRTYHKYQQQRENDTTHWDRL